MVIKETKGIEAINKGVENNRNKATIKASTNLNKDEINLNNGTTSSTQRVCARV